MPTATDSGRIQLAGRTLSLSWLREHATEAAPLFTRAKAEVGHASCLCRQPALRLVIRCTRAGRYHLAGWPGEGEKHQTDCPFHKLAPGLSGRDGYSTHAIRETDDEVSIRLDAPLARTLTTPEQHNLTPNETPEGRSRRALGLLGLLHWLWEETQLNAWLPRFRQRSWWVCHTRLRQQLRDCTINGQNLHDVLYVVPPFTRATADTNTAALETFRSHLGRHGQTEQRGMVLGQIKDVARTRYGVAYRLAHQRTPLYASAALHERATHSYRHAFSQVAAAHGAAPVALFVVERSRRGYLTAIDLAAMLTTAYYIPADSSYEAVMANALTAARRGFIKPLRYDGTDAVFPDFVLTDTDPHQFVEVYGIRGRETYDRRKRTKQAIYQRQGRPLLEWDVAGPLPALAPPEQLRAPSRSEARGRSGHHRPR
ncbi:DUF1173 family protein [Streptomyces lydicus]|uniref:DUF1173 family protein n=1 Tax=Streptomyces lydicus TaxID=47763 RepID=UPI001013252E|nr:DUF1173 family protein [Streptomyces lydicus]MCZ1011970.1 DUF1173 family protein [Streptomyces lydicus]